MDYGHYIDFEEGYTYLKKYSDENLPLYFDEKEHHVYSFEDPPSPKKTHRYYTEYIEEEHEDEDEISCSIYNFVTISIKYAIHSIATIGVIVFISSV
jgi:hypothetical protein